MRVFACLLRFDFLVCLVVSYFVCFVCSCVGLLKGVCRPVYWCSFFFSISVYLLVFVFFRFSLERKKESSEK